MNREIKFRAWVPKGYTRWGGGGLVMLSWQDLLDDLHSELNPKKSVMGLGMSHAEEGVVFMQSTGLKDKNGKEIYEGDIVRIRHEEDMHEHEEEGCEKGCTFGDDAWKTIEVKWDSEITGYFFDSEALFGHEYNLPIVTEGYETEIIGNIYENPELLK